VNLKTNIPMTHNFYRAYYDLGGLSAHVFILFLPHFTWRHIAPISRTICAYYMHISSKQQQKQILFSAFPIQNGCCRSGDVICLQQMARLIIRH